MAKENVETQATEQTKEIKEPIKAPEKPASRPGVRKAYYVGDDIRSNSLVSEFEKKLKELEDIASKMAPRGILCVTLGSAREGYSPILVGVRSLISATKIFSGQRIMRNPKLAGKLAKIGEHTEAINKVINGEIKIRRQRAMEAQVAKEKGKQKK